MLKTRFCQFEPRSGPVRSRPAIGYAHYRRVGKGVPQFFKRVPAVRSPRLYDRLLGRPTFFGPVEPGRRYVLVDDVTVMGGTLAELSDHIRRGGGEVVGAATLVNASRSGVRGAPKQHIRLVEARYGNIIREEFGISPNALTGDEALVIARYRDADARRTAITAAKIDRERRLLQKGLPGPSASQQKPS